MKKLLFTIIAFLMLYSMAFAAGSCVLTDVTSTQIAAESNRIPDSFTVDVKLVCTDDGSGITSKTIPVSGYYPQTYLNTYNLTGYYLYQVKRTPGNNSASVASCTSTCPAASYTVTITDASGFALDLALLTSNGSASATQMTGIYSTTVVYPTVQSDLVVAITGVTNASAKVTLDLIFKSQ
jgi:hypothetical protein